ncbi:MAG: hypothetical protein LBH49_03330 [Puniceicoccales bacterium]|jgi:hypothetical protein|nr:hypothetical protein [Puniceicoccales bacterium]
MTSIKNPQIITSTDQPRTDEIRNENNIAQINANEFHYLKFKKAIWSALNVTPMPMNDGMIFNTSTTDINNIKKINSISDKKIIAEVLIGQIAELDKLRAKGERSLSSHRQPGDDVCLNVLSDLVNVAILSFKDANPVFRNDDLKNLMAVFCQNKFNLLTAVCDNSNARKEIFNAIKNGMNRTDSKKLSKSKKENLENVMASTLQSMSGMGQSEYKNVTIFGREEKSESLKFFCYIVATASTFLAAAGTTIRPGMGTVIGMAIGTVGGIVLGAILIRWL